MIVSHNETPVSGVITCPVVGENAGKRCSAGLTAEEACAEEDDDEDDIARRDGSVPPVLFALSIICEAALK